MPFPSVKDQFKPGNPGRPAGRPKTVEDWLKELLDREAPNDDGTATTLAERVAWEIVEKVLSGSGKFTQILLERTSGKVRQAVEHEGELTIRVEYVDRDPETAEAPPETGGDPRL